jgi:hypothetical protein
MHRKKADPRDDVLKMGTTREKWGLTILSQGANPLGAGTPQPGASGQNGLSPFFAPSTFSYE